MKEDPVRRLEAIMAKLRSENGCPWDREQTHRSLRPYLIEEAYEAVEAIDSGDPAKIREELGDVLLQVVFHAQVARENGGFTLDDIAEGICEKMVRRHPMFLGMCMWTVWTAFWLIGKGSNRRKRVGQAPEKHRFWPV